MTKPNNKQTNNVKQKNKKLTNKSKNKKETFISLHNNPKEEYPHFRHYLKANHPALIVEEHSKDEYKYRKVTHSEREGNRPNEKIFPNPNPNDKEPMYIGKRIRHDKKKNFSQWLYKWKLRKK